MRDADALSRAKPIKQLKALKRAAPALADARESLPTLLVLPETALLPPPRDWTSEPLPINLVPVSTAPLVGPPPVLGSGGGICCIGYGAPIVIFPTEGGEPTPAVPEPASWAMLTAGMFIAGGALRRRARGSGREDRP